MSYKIDLTGQTVGLLEVVEYYGSATNKGSLWRCRCSCDPTKDLVIRGSIIKNSPMASCGCEARRRRSKANTKHGLYVGIPRTKEGRAFIDMIARCLSPKHSKYHYYGGRQPNPVQICQSWRYGGFESFLHDMGPAPGPEYSIDRIDSQGHYQPCNCRWLPLDENRRRALKNRVGF